MWAASTRLHAVASRVYGLDMGMREDGGEVRELVRCRYLGASRGVSGMVSQVSGSRVCRVPPCVRVSERLKILKERVTSWSCMQTFRAPLVFNFTSSVMAYKRSREESNTSVHNHGPCDVHTFECAPNRQCRATPFCPVPTYDYMRMPLLLLAGAGELQLLGLH
jgi:hypothetical protein